MTRARFRLNLLGPPGLEAAGTPVHLATRKALALLAVVTAQRQGTDRGSLAALLWPEKGEEGARASLRQELSRLSQALGNALQKPQQSLKLDPEMAQIDLWEFWEALECGEDARALELHRGPFLQGLQLRDTAEFESWQDTLQQEIQAQYLAALSRQAEREAAAGNRAGALALHRQAVATDPLAEGHYLVAMELCERLGDQTGALAELSAALDNLRAAWAWKVQGGYGDGIGEMAEGLFLLHELRGLFREGVELFATACDLPDPKARSMVLARKGRLLYRLLEFAEAEADLEAALEIARSLGDLAECAFCINNLGLVALGQGQTLLAQKRFEESLALRQTAGSRWGAASSLHNLGLVAWQMGEFERARARFQEALDLFRRVGDARGLSLASTGVGQVWTSLGQYAVARELFRQGSPTPNSSATASPSPAPFWGWARWRASSATLRSATATCKAASRRPTAWATG